VAIIDFLGRSIGAEPEYFVEKDPRAMTVDDNPNETLDIMESEDGPEDGSPSVDYEGMTYYLAKDEGYPWNREVFRILHQLFEMSVSEVPNAGVPSITIAK
jgi:hypothetical protein